MVTLAALARVLLAAASLAAAQQNPGPLSASAQTENPAPVAATASASAVSASPASKDLPLLPAPPQMPPLTKAVPWEYFTVVTLLSAPFTALWCGLVVGVVEAIAQRQVPPKFSSSMYAAVGAAAGTASVSIGLFSLYWGGPKEPSGRPAETPLPRPRTPLLAPHATPEPSPGAPHA